MEKLIDISSYPVANVLGLLLQDKTAKKNIIWATDTYEEFGEGFTDKEPMEAAGLLQQTDIIRPRIQKSLEEQAQRTRKKAEVFTPGWLCNQMNNALDEDWFERTGVFNTENTDHTWTVSEGKIEFPAGKNWQSYVDSRRLEITCGEAPYLVSRYDVATGELITPPIQRIGILDRKLRIVNENTDTYDDWLKWTIRAFEACYGYEYQGDNVLIARINLLLTFLDYYEERWRRRPDDGLLKRIANKIAWNIWQMDGLKDTVPLGKPYEPCRQMSIFDLLELEDDAGPCRICNWRSKFSMKFIEVKEKRAVGKKLFDYVIGNPPYQEETQGTSDKPVYNLFMDAAFDCADKVELITPGRFLFDAGKTPKMWNEKMLNDEHLKVMKYEQDSSKVFHNTDIKGGVAITYRDATQNFGSIGTFSPFDELNSILKKVKPFLTEQSLDDTIVQQNRWNLDALYNDYPEYKSRIGSNGTEKRLTTPIFSSLKVFSETPQPGCIKILGLIKNKRHYRFIDEKYIESYHDNLNSYKVIIPASNGSGAIGEVLSTPLVGEPLVGEPLVGYTQSFIGIGTFDTEAETEACLKYIKSKFARTMLGILKITQHNHKGTWKYVPLQDFTPSSDIDWSKSIHEIDLQLYRKYGLDEKEIEFIETHVKEMA